MRGALGQPLTEIPAAVLNRMVSKDVALNLRKFKLNAGYKTPSKRSKSRGDRIESPISGVRGKSNDSKETAGSYGNQIRKQMKQLDSGIADRT
jgi:hypothetical protein